jgi:hypothetical protein
MFIIDGGVSFCLASTAPSSFRRRCPLPPALQIIKHLAGMLDTGGGGGEAWGSSGEMAGVSSAVLPVFLVVGSGKRRSNN